MIIPTPRLVKGAARAECFRVAVSRLPLDKVPDNLRERVIEWMEDEAAAWKRVICYRLAKQCKPPLIVETHQGEGVASLFYKLGSPQASFVSMSHYQTEIPLLRGHSVGFADVDPYGHPYEALDMILPKLKRDCILSVTNGEILQVSRGLGHTFLKSEHKGKDCLKYVEGIMIPYLTKLLNRPLRFYYVYPSSVRMIFSNVNIDPAVFKDCPRYLSWTRPRHTSRLK